MPIEHDVTWNHKLWDIIAHIYWTPSLIGLKSIPAKEYPAGYELPTAMKGKGWRLYRRDRKLDALLSHLQGREEVLNFFFNIAMAIAPDEVLSQLFCRPLGIGDPGPFASLGSDVAARYHFESGENLTQPDGFFSTNDSLVATELKLLSHSWPEQIAKYVALMRWEQKRTGQRKNLGLLFVLPAKSVRASWSKVRLDELPDVAAFAEPNAVRRCPPTFFDELDRRKLPKKVCQLFDSESDQIRTDLKRLRIASVSWTWLRDQIRTIETVLDCSCPGDQTLKRLLAGLRFQIEGHRNTGIVVDNNARHDIMEQLPSSR